MFVEKPTVEQRSMKFKVIDSTNYFVVGTRFTQQNLDTQHVKEKFKTLEFTIVCGLSV